MTSLSIQGRVGRAVHLRMAIHGLLACPQALLTSLSVGTSLNEA
jgi:hypothetical protein